MRKISILWVDDEIDLLKVHILFLKQKGYDVFAANNGTDAIEKVRNEFFDIIFLDENMPGLSGLETLAKIREINPSIPVIMVTKSDEEDMMDEAIASRITDYLIKPVNPKQILLSIKKYVDVDRLMSEKTSESYQSEFAELANMISSADNFDDWINIYKKLVHWELELERSNVETMEEILKFQKDEANTQFAKFIKNNYLDWVTGKDAPLMSHKILDNKITPVINENKKIFFIVIDNLRFDQWKTLQPIITKFFILENEEIYSSILPTSTQFARNAIFSGMMPLGIQQRYPQLWIHDFEDGGKNEHEEDLLKHYFDSHGLDIDFTYNKIMNKNEGKKLVDNFKNLINKQFNVIVFNFVDMLSHARTESKMIRELANNEAAYRSLTRTWFDHSSLPELFKKIAEVEAQIFITTDHGTIRVNNPVKVIGDRFTTTNLRYKQGKNLNFNPKEVFAIHSPKAAGLPTPNISTSYIFATHKDFFAYPNNYNYYVKYYKDTFQHGGISLEEMLIPFISLKTKQ